MAKQAEAEREKRAKVIAAEGELLASVKLAETADIMAKHPIALQLRNLQTMAEISVDLPALGNPTNPTSANNFSSKISWCSSPGVPGVAVRGA